MGQRHNRKRTRSRPQRERAVDNLVPTPQRPELHSQYCRSVHRAKQPMLQAGKNHGKAPSSPLFSPPESACFDTTSCGSPTLLRAYAGPSRGSVISVFHAIGTPGPITAESTEARMLRIFGGVEGEHEESDLCAPMLDVVLGLFDAVDYDDGVC